MKYVVHTQYLPFRFQAEAENGFWVKIVSQDSRFFIVNHSLCYFKHFKVTASLQMKKTDLGLL